MTPHQTAGLLLALLLLSPAAASAQQPRGAAPKSADGYLGAELAFGQLDEDFFTLLNFTFGLKMKAPKVGCAGNDCKTDLTLGLNIPLRLRTIDRDPSDSGTLRQEDWDEPGDYLRVLRFVEYGAPQERLHLRMGELGGAVLGHGTVMNRYFNVLDVDHNQFGAHVNVNDRVGGAQVIVDHLLDPEVVAFRGYMRPWALLAPGAWMERYAVGASLALDIDAPLAFERVNVLDDPRAPYRVDGQRNLKPSRAEVTGVFSIDQELLLVDEAEVDFAPFLDLNFHLDGDPGLHLGALVNLRPSSAFRLHSRAELRWLGERYLPDYFGSIYEIERDTYYGFGGQGAPKLVVLKEQARGSHLGAYGEATFDVVDVLSLTMGYEDYQGPDNAGLLLRLELPPVGPLSAGALYRKVGFDNLDSALSPSDGLLVAEARWHFLANFYALGQLSRLWRLKPESRLGEHGSPYETVNTWFLGAGASLGF